MKKEPSTSIGFRLTGEHQAALAARARVAGVSLHECARNLVIAGLETKPDPNVDGIAELRQDLALILEAALIAGRILTPEEAKELIQGKLFLLP